MAVGEPETTTPVKLPAKNVARTAPERTTGNRLAVRTSVTVILDQPVALGDAFTLDAGGGAAVKKSAADATEVDDKHVAIRFDKLKEKGIYALTHRRGASASVTLFRKTPLPAMVFPGERVVDVTGKNFYSLVDSPPAAKDPDLAGDFADFAKIQVKEPKAT